MRWLEKGELQILAVPLERVRKRPSASAQGKPREDLCVTIDRSDKSTAFIKVRCQLHTLHRLLWWRWKLNMCRRESLDTQHDNVTSPGTLNRRGKPDLRGSDIPDFLILLAVLAGAALLARRLDIAPAILLLLAGGLALAFVPEMPALELPPQLVLLLGAAATDLFGQRRHELARVQVQLAAPSSCCRSAA